MRQPISFAAFLKLPADEVEALQTQQDYSGWNIWTEESLRVVREELSPNAKKKMMIDLERKLKVYDFWYVMGSRADWEKGKKAEIEIKKMIDDLGDEAKALYKKYAKKVGVQIREGLIPDDGISPSTRASIKDYMKDLEKLCRKHNWHWMYEADETLFRKGKKEEQEIRELVVEIKELGSIEGFELYQKYAAKNGIKIKYFREEKKDNRPSEYEIFLHKKMKAWNVKSLDELEGEAKKRFDAECERDWKGNPEVKVNLPESIFPEMAQVQRQGTLGYGDDRKVGEKSLTAGSFCDAGNLYENIPTWQPPTKERKRYLK